MLYPNLAVGENGRLFFAGHDTVELARSYGTPLVVMDESLIRSRCRTYKAALAEDLPAGSRPLYASKAFCCRRMCAIAQEEGLGLDVVSPGELYTALLAGFPAEDIFFHGNNKTDADIRYAIESRIGYIVCDNRYELAAIENEAAALGVRQKILLRITPGIDPHTHEKINTGRVDSKFGSAIDTGDADVITGEALKAPHVDLRGFHCHVGSQLFDCSPLCDAAEIMVAFLRAMRDRYGYDCEILNLGSGFGVRYEESDPVIDYAAETHRVTARIRAACAEQNISVPVVLLEPGRSIVADAGITLYTVGGIKHIPGLRNFVSVDGGMTDNPRFTLYQAVHGVLDASHADAKPSGYYTVAGRCCESGDRLAEGAPLPRMERGDVLAMLTTGAYTYSMASNYNRVARPAVVFLGEQGPYIAVRRETFQDLTACDV